MKATAMGKVTRNDRLSCSQLPALMGHDGYGKTANDVLRRCIAAIDGKEDDFTPNEAMKWGSRLELPILEEAAERLGMELEHGFDKAFVCKTVPLECSMDGIVTPVLNNQVIETDFDAGIIVLNDAGRLVITSPGCLESKLTSLNPEDSPPLHRGPLQLQGQMMCAGLKWGAIATLYRGTELKVFVFEAHPGTQEAIRLAAVDFEARLTGYSKTGVPEWFPVQSPEDGARTFPVTATVPDPIALPEEAAELAEAIEQAESEIKAAQERKDGHTARLMDMMGQAEVAVAGRYQIKWGSRSYKAQPEKIVPAKEAYTIRSKTLAIKEIA